MRQRIAAACLLACLPLAAASKHEFRAGVARVEVTPSKPVWLSGYASRKKPAEGTLSPLFAKVLALEDRKGYRVVIVTSDLIGFPGVMTDELAARIGKKWNLNREQILFNSSHTHTGPVVRPNLATMYSLTPEQDADLQAYSRELVEKIFGAVGNALGDLAPASLRTGQSTAGFAINRRQATPKGVALGLNPSGPVDHSVPVVEVRDAAGKVKAVLFGYACHNTTLTGEHYKYSADYAGFAQEEVERAHPGTTALFLLLCGGDQNPNPRSEERHARDHGKALAAAVEQALSGTLESVHSPVRAVYQQTKLAFRPHTRADFETEAKDANPYKVNRAKAMLAAYDQRREIRFTPYPVQAIRFSKDLTLLALGGEVVVDYALRAKKEFPRERLVVAGYSNDVMCYIPSLRVLKEGGYEAESSMIYYGMPGPFSEEVEESVFATIRAVMKRAGAK